MEDKKWEGKECFTCHLYKPIFDYYENPFYKDGYDKICKDCKKDYNRKYYLEHKQYWVDRRNNETKTASEIRKRKMRKRDRKRRKEAKMALRSRTFGKVQRRNDRKFYLDIPSN